MLFFAVLFNSCKNEDAIRPRLLPSPGTQNTTPPVNQNDTSLANITPNVSAGADIFLVLPLNSCTLIGSAQYPESIHTVSWKKISGPGSFVIQNPSSLETKVSNLEKGVYEFELTIANKAGLTGKNSVFVTVMVEGTGKNEKIYQDLRWVCPMGCHLRIENFHAFVPVGIAFKAYLKRDNSTQWVEVVNGSQAWSEYMWTFYNNELVILEDQTGDPEDTPDVKIVF